MKSPTPKKKAKNPTKIQKIIVIKRKKERKGIRQSIGEAKNRFINIIVK